MRFSRFLHPSRVVVLLAAAAALVGGFFLATSVFGGGDTPGDLEFPRAIDPSPEQYLDLRPGDPGFGEFASEFADFPVYWVGEEFQGHPLRHIVRSVFSPQDGSPTENKVAFIYGACTTGGEGGCAPPLQIIIEPYCLVPPSLIDPSRVASGPSKVRGGAEAVAVGGGLRIWTGDVTIKIYAATQQLMDDATAAFVSANGMGPAAAGAVLPEPNTDCSAYETVPLR